LVLNIFENWKFIKKEFYFLGTGALNRVGLRDGTANYLFVTILLYSDSF
jgi:hypothetical protein